MDLVDELLSQLLQKVSFRDAIIDKVILADGEHRQDAPCQDLSLVVSKPRTNVEFKRRLVCKIQELQSALETFCNSVNAVVQTFRRTEFPKVGLPVHFSSGQNVVPFTRELQSVYYAKRQMMLLEGVLGKTAWQERHEANKIELLSSFVNKCRSLRRLVDLLPGKDVSHPGAVFQLCYFVSCLLDCTAQYTNLCRRLNDMTDNILGDSHFNYLNSAMHSFETNVVSRIKEYEQCVKNSMRNQVAAAEKINQRITKVPTIMYYRSNPHCKKGLLIPLPLQASRMSFRNNLQKQRCDAIADLMRSALKDLRKETREVGTQTVANNPTLRTHFLLLPKSQSLKLKSYKSVTTEQTEKAVKCDKIERTCDELVDGIFQQFCHEFSTVCNDLVDKIYNDELLASK